MSTNTYPVFFNSTLLTDSNSTFYTVPDSPTNTVLQELQIKVTNYTAATRQVTLYAVPSGQSASNSNAMVLKMSVPPHDYIIVPCPRLGTEGTIEGYADATSSLNVQPIGGKLHTP